MPRNVHTPPRTDEIVALARRAKALYAGLTIDQIAEREGIILQRINGAGSDVGGLSYVEIMTRPKLVESLAQPGKYIRVRGQVEKYPLEFIVINPDYPASEEEIFWHELYHLWYSPSGSGLLGSRVNCFSTHGILNDQEERRANTFAAAIVIDRIGEHESVEELMDRCGVSRSLAQLAMERVKQFKA